MLAHVCSSVVERLTRDRRAAGLSLTGVTALSLWARHINPSFVLVQPRKTRPYITERLLMGCKESNKTNQQFVLYLWYFFSQPDEYAAYLHDTIIMYARVLNKSLSENDTSGGEDLRRWGPYVFFKGKVYLTRISLVSFLRDIGKQCRPRSDAAESGVWAGSPLFAYRKFNQNLNKMKNNTQDP